MVGLWFVSVVAATHYVTEPVVDVTWIDRELTRRRAKSIEASLADVAAQIPQPFHTVAIREQADRTNALEHVVAVGVLRAVFPEVAPWEPSAAGCRIGGRSASGTLPLRFCRQRDRPALGKFFDAGQPPRIGARFPPGDARDRTVAVWPL
jgi:hypothetical protein